MKKILFCVLFIISASSYLMAQYTEGFEYEGGMLYNKELENPLSYQLTAKYNYYFNKYLGISFGGMMLYSNINERLKSPIEVDYIYIMDNNIIKLNAVLGLKYSRQLFKNVGVVSDMSFGFEPIPIDWLSYKKTKIKGTIKDDSSKTKFVFTQFNPSAFLNIGLYYDIKDKNNNNILRLNIGCGIGYYNPYITYYRSSIDKIKLKQHLTLKPQKTTYSFYFRFSSIKF